MNQNNDKIFAELIELFGKKGIIRNDLSELKDSIESIAKVLSKNSKIEEGAPRTLAGDWKDFTQELKDSLINRPAAYVTGKKDSYKDEKNDKVSAKTNTDSDLTPRKKIKKANRVSSQDNSKIDIKRNKILSDMVEVLIDLKDDKTQLKIHSELLEINKLMSSTRNNYERTIKPNNEEAKQEDREKLAEAIARRLDGMGASGREKAPPTNIPAPPPPIPTKPPGPPAPKPAPAPAPAPAPKPAPKPVEPVPKPVESVKPSGARQIDRGIEAEAAKKAEMEAAKKAEMEAAKKAEAEKKRLAEEDAAKKAKEAEAEAAKKAEAEKKRLAEEEKKRLAEEEKKRLAEEEKKRLAEEEKKKAAEEEKKRLAEEEKKKAADEKAAKDVAKKEEERIAAKNKKQAEEEANKREEAKRLADAEKKRLADEEKKRLAEEEKLRKDEAKRLADEEKKRLEKETADRAKKAREEAEVAKKAREEAAKKAREEAEVAKKAEAQKTAKPDSVTPAPKPVNPSGPITFSNPVKGQYYSEYGKRGILMTPQGPTDDIHHGIDYRAKFGEPVSPIAEGKVIFTGLAGNAGIMVKVLHSNGIISEYMHLSKVNVKTGDTINSSNVIAEVGSTGRSTGTHLHVGTYREGELIMNPKTGKKEKEKMYFDPTTLPGLNLKFLEEYKKGDQLSQLSIDNMDFKKMGLMGLGNNSVAIVSNMNVTNTEQTTISKNTPIRQNSYQRYWNAAA